MALIPDNRLISTTPIPLTSILWFINSLVLPIILPSLNFLNSTVSSEISLCPLDINSKVASLLPTPLLPSIKTPTPKTSTSPP